MNGQELTTIVGAKRISTRALNIMSTQMSETLKKVGGLAELFNVGESRYYCLLGNRITRTSERDAAFKIIPILNLQNSNKNYGFLFTLNSDGWYGTAFGTLGYLYFRMQDRRTPQYCSVGFLTKLYNNLLDKECWKTGPEDNPSYARLRSYLVQLSLLARRKLQAGGTADVVLNASGTAAMYDSNLLDAYGNRIFIVHEICTTVSEDEGMRLVNPFMLTDLGMAEECGFTKEDLSALPPFSVYASKSDLIFSGDVDLDFLCDLSHLQHIHQERMERLPQDLREMEPFTFAAMIRASVEYALKRSKVDYTYIKPSYSALEQNVCFLIPIYKSMRVGVPDCVLLISKKRGTWAAYTILTVEQAYTGARLIAPQSSWLVL